MFAMTFYPKPMFWDFFWGGSKWDLCLEIFLCKIHPFGGTSPYILHRALREVLLSPSVGPGCRGTQIILISSIYGMNRYEIMRILQPSYEKRKCWKGAPIWKGISWNTRKGHPTGAPHPGCPRVCPPWAHRSYATAYPAYRVSCYTLWGKLLQFVNNFYRSSCTTSSKYYLFLLSRKQLPP